MSTTLEQYLRAAAARLDRSETPLLDARVLAKHALGLDDAGLILAGDRPLGTDERAKVDALVDRRAAGEPVAHIVGEKEFYGLTFRTAPGVLTPRPDSETLVEAVLARRDHKARLRILDLGTGTGCLLCTLLTLFPDASGVGVDINPAAARLARENAAALGLAGRASILIGDWTAALTGAFDVIVSNPPYIREDEFGGLARDIRDFEDRRAFVAGPDGLSGYRRILAAAPGLIGSGGLTVLELGIGQADAVSALAEAAFPGAGVSIDRDLAGRERALTIDLSRQKSV